ncbi:Ig-like domain repeat protein [Gemmata sp. JC673]|uniref:Ig-like domain repeat protein n=1 Tax=Gemmata algarum TaxID=2975278 RepID=A0ABU5EWC6_9BACT|nr:Ig-like domain repeat protein [Gemmata algarum]MDY3559430.1 Ig-like domain repeat protein [Gemmata algarum]
MLPSWLRQLFRNKFTGHGTVAPFRSLAVETLEDRALLTTAIWTGAYSANHPTLPADYTWSNRENWAPVQGYGFYRPGDDGDGVPDDVLFPAIADGRAKPNATITITNGVGVFAFAPNSIMDGDYRINDLRIEGDNYRIDSLSSHTLTLDGRLLANFAGTVGPVSGLSLLGPLPSANQISNLKVVLNDNVTTNPGFGPANQFVNSNTGELYITATLTDGFSPSTATVRPSGLIKSGTGTITLAGGNTYSGVTSVQAGILVAASDGALGSSVAQTVVSNGATIGISNGAVVSDSLEMIGAGAGGLGALRAKIDVFQQFSTSVPLVPPFTNPTGFGTWAGGISILGNASIGVDAFLPLGGLSITTKGIGGTGNLTKVGIGQLSLLVDSTYAGDTLITEGGVSIFTDAALSAGFRTVVSSEASLNVDSGLTVNENVVLTGDGYNGYNDGFGRPAGALSLIDVGVSTWLGSVTLTAAGASIGSVGGGTLTLAGSLIGPSGTTLSKVDRGRVRIARANSTYLGTTRIDNGTLEVADAAALGAGAITVNSTTGAQPAVGTLQLEGNYTLSQRLTLNGVGDSTTGAVHVVAPAGSGALGASSITVAGGIVLNSTTSLNVDPRSVLTVSGVISDVAQTPAAELNKLGGGTLVLSGTNTYTGQTVLRDGVTSIQSARALGATGAGTTVNTGAILSLDGGANGLTVTGEALSISGSNGFSTSTIRAGVGANVWAGPINFIDNQGAPLNVEALAGATLELRGSLGGAAAIHKVGAGTVSFTGTTANTLTGTIYIDSGVLALGNTGGNATNGAVVVGDGAGSGTDQLRLLAANQLADNKSVTVNSTGLFDLNGFSETIGGAISLIVAGGRVQTGNGVLSLNGDVNTYGTAAASNIDGNVFLTATRTFLFLPTPQLTIQSTANSSQFGNAVTFVVTAFPFGTEPAVGGSVTFYDGDTRIGSVQVLQSNGVGTQTTAAVTTTTLSGGLHTIRAVYSGNNSYAPTTITMAQQQAVRNTPVYSTLLSSNLTAEPNQNVTFTYRATSPVGSISPTGTVTFYDNGVQIGTAQTLTTDGFAYLTTSFAIPATAAERLHTITATYSGDLFFSSNTVTLSAPADPGSPYTRPVTQQVGYDPLVQLSTDFNSVPGDRSPTINFTASGANGLPTPSGSVQFYVDGVAVGTEVAVDANGKASLTLGTDASAIASATWAGGVVTVTTTGSHHLETGNTVTITGLTPAGFNGTFTVTRLTDTMFTYALGFNPGTYIAPTANGSAVINASWSGGRAVITTSGLHGLTTGSMVTITGLTPSGFNGTYAVTRLSATQFSYALVNSPGAFVGGVSRRVGISLSNATWTSNNGGTAVITTSVAHNLNTGDTVTISGLNPSEYNGTFVIIRTSATQFTYSLPRPTDPGSRVNGGSVIRTGAGIANASWAAGFVTVTTTGSHNLEDGDFVTLTGMTRDGYNGTHQVERISDTQFRYVLLNDPGVYVTNTAAPAQNATIALMAWANGVVTVTTAGTHNFRNGDVVTIAANNTASPAGSAIPSAPAGYNGTFVVTVLSNTQFQYALQLNPGFFVSSFVPPGIQTIVNQQVIGASWLAGQVTITTQQAHGLTVGSQVQIANLSPAGYNGTYTITSVPNGNTFTYALAGDPGVYSNPSVTNGVTTSTITNATWAGGTATFTTSTAHILTVGQTVTISGVNPTGYNGTYQVTFIGSGNTFQVSIPTAQGTFVVPRATGVRVTQIQSATWANGVITANTNGAHNLAVGDTFTISGALPAGYNGTYTVASVVDLDTFTFARATDPGPFFMGTSNGSANSSATVAATSIATVTPVGLSVGSHEVTAEFRSSDQYFTDARATYSASSNGSTANLAANTPVVYQMLTSRTAVQLSTIAGDDPVISDPASYTFRVNSNDTVNYEASGFAGDPFHPNPTGSVDFLERRADGSTRFLGTVPIGMIGVLGGGGLQLLAGTPGEASIMGVRYTRDQYSVGSVTITGIYSGDQYYAESTQTVQQQLIATNTPIKLATSNTTAIIGETVEFTADVSTLAAMNVPTLGAGFVRLTFTNTTTGRVYGPIQFFLGNQGRPGVGLGSFTFTEAGVYTVAGTFTATSTAIGSGAVNLTSTITVLAPFDAVVTSNLPPSAPAGTSVTFTFRSTMATGVGEQATGTVEFYDGVNKIGTTQVLAADGTASITLDTLSIGAHTISAVFTPNGTNYRTTRWFMDKLQVVGTPPTLDINLSSSMIVEGDAVTVRVTVAGDPATPPTGRVDLYANGLLLESGVLVRNGVAVYTTNAATNFTAGRYEITAHYSGDAAYAPAIGTMTQDVVVINPVRFQVRSSANANVVGSTVDYPVVAGSTVTYTAELRTNSTATPNPLTDATGSVTFNLVDANGIVVATTGPISLSTVVVVIDATTTFRTPTAVGTLTAPAGTGSYRVVAVYSGDVNYEPLQTTFSQTVVATAGDLPAAAPGVTTVNRVVPTLNVNGSITGGATTGLVSSASGTLVLNGSNNYGGSTLITGAGNTVVLGTSNALPDTTALTITAGALNVNGKTDTVGSLTGTGTVQLPAGSAFTTGALNTSTDFTGTLTGAGVLNKIGTGTLTLAGSGAGYTGTTVVTGGTVFLASSYGNANVTVQPGATLAGSGIAKAVTVAAGGRVSPGGTSANPNTVGTLTGTGNLTLSPGAVFAVNVDGPNAGAPTNGYDQYLVNSGGSVNLNGATLQFNLGYAPALNTSFTLISVSGGGTVTGTFANLPTSGSTFVLNDRVYAITYGATSVSVQLVALASTASLTSSPNPSLPGESVTFTATITPNASGDPVPVGNIQFYVNGVATGAPVPVTQVGSTNAAAATFTTTLLPSGPNLVTATFTPTGGSAYPAFALGNTAMQVTQLVTVPSTLTVTAQQGPITFGGTASFLAAVAQTGGQAPTGTFTFANAATGAVLAVVALDGTGRAVFSTTALPAGTATVTVTYSGDSFYRASTATVTQVVDRQNRVVVGSDAGPVATVQVFDPRTGALVGTFQPFDQYTGGVKVATGDVNNDGVADIVVSAGAGAPGGHVKVYDGVSFGLLSSFFTFPGYNGGVNVAVGDVNGDGFGDVVIGTAVGNDHVKAFSGRSLLNGGIAGDGTADPSTILSFFAYGGGNPVGVTVAAGDVDGDGRADVITGSATFAGHVKAFSASGQQIGSYFAYGAGYLGGIYVAAGDLNGDGRAEIVTGATNAPHVKALRLDGTEVASFFAYTNGDGSPAPFGVRVAVADRNGDRLADILTGSAGGAPHVKAFSGLDPSLLLDSFLAIPPGQAPSTSGVFVGGSAPK